MSFKKQQHYPVLDPVSTGIKARCPRCGEGRLFSGLLTVRGFCSACGLNYDFNDAGDGPTVFIIMGLGFLVLGGALFVELSYQPAVWVHIVTWPLVTLALGIPALRMLKGVLIALTWHHDAAEGRIDNNDQEAD